MTEKKLQIKNIYKCLLLLFVAFLFISNIVFIVITIKNIKSTNKFDNSASIFNNSISSVVELKSETKGFGETYGSAVFIKKEGYLITAAHVVTYQKDNSTQTYQSYQIRFADQKQYTEVVLIKYDIEKDLAYLKLKEPQKTKFTPLKIRDEELKHGEIAFSVGNGLNQGISITKGIVSQPLVNIKHNGLSRKMIQLNITINEGNSGGAVLDNNGMLIGIVSFRIRDKRGNIIYGVGYAVPYSEISKFILK